MQKLHTPENFVFRIMALALSASLLFTGCSLTAGKTKEKIGDLQLAETAYSDGAYHFLDANSLIYITQSGLVELYLDTKTYGICIRDINTGKYWTALPMDGQEVAENPATMLSMTVFKNGTRYELNAQDHAVAFHSASFKPTEDGLIVTYDMALDEKTAGSVFDTLPPDALYVSVPVQYTLKDGTLYVSIHKQDILTTPGCIIESIELLNYFGATTEDHKNNYIFVPDGSGAISYMQAPQKDEKTVKTFIPYGADLASTERPEDKKSAQVAAFGMKSGDSAFLAWIENGATASEITSHAKAEKEPYYRVGTKFYLQNVAYSGKNSKKVQHVSERHAGEIKICYRFLSHNNAGYAGMATACRELLIRRGILSTKSVEPTDYLPFLLTAQASVPKKHGTGVKTLTTFEELEELLAMMKAKGMDNVFVRYNGVLQGSSCQKSLKSADLLGKLGSNKKLESLLQYVKTQQFSMFLNLDICAFKNAKTARSLINKPISVMEANPFSAFSGQPEFKKELMTLSHVERGVDQFVNGKNDERFSGYCMDDAGRILYADYKQGYSRLEAADIFAKQAATLSAGHKLMVDTGNVYMLKNADVISNLPSATAYAVTENYEPVPFLQMIFHGILDYAHAPVNLSENPQEAFLKSMEYGAIPSYAWYYEKTQSEELDALYHYEKQINKAAENYKKANETLNDLRDARLTRHGKVQEGVYFTEYNNNVLLYFNYNEKAVTVNGITIAPMSFLRIN